MTPSNNDYSSLVIGIYLDGKHECMSAAYSLVSSHSDATDVVQMVRGYPRQPPKLTTVPTYLHMTADKKKVTRIGDQYQVAQGEVALNWSALMRKRESSAYSSVRPNFDKDGKYLGSFPKNPPIMSHKDTTAPLLWHIAKATGDYIGACHGPDEGARILQSVGKNVHYVLTATPLTTEGDQDDSLRQACVQASLVRAHNLASRLTIIEEDEALARYIIHVSATPQNITDVLICRGQGLPIIAYTIMSRHPTTLKRTVGPFYSLEDCETVTSGATKLLKARLAHTLWDNNTDLNRLTGMLETLLNKKPIGTTNDGVEISLGPSSLETSFRSIHRGRPVLTDAELADDESRRIKGGVLHLSETELAQVYEPRLVYVLGALTETLEQLAGSDKDRQHKRANVLLLDPLAHSEQFASELQRRIRAEASLCKLEADLTEAVTRGTVLRFLDEHGRNVL